MPGTTRAPSTAALESPSILIVDDDSRIRRTLKRLLSRAGYVVLEAASGTQSLALVAERRDEANSISAVILDLLMPEMTGDVVLTALLEIDPGLPIIILSGTMTREAERELLLAGARACLHKPAENAHLLETLRASLVQSSEPS